MVLSKPGPAFLNAGLHEKSILGGEHAEFQKLKQLSPQPQTIDTTNALHGVAKQQLGTRPSRVQPWCQHLHHGSGLLVSLLRFRMGVIDPGWNLVISS